VNFIPASVETLSCPFSERRKKRQNPCFTKTKTMFGLENITDRQFAIAILLCLLGYYLILLMYLALKKINPPRTASFESIQPDGEIKPQTIKAGDFPTTAASTIEADTNALKVIMPKEPDYSGYALDTLQNTLTQDKETFLNNIEYELQST
jgi:hypothetical protein